MVLIGISITPCQGIAQQKRSDSLETVLNAIRREWGTIVDTTIVNLLNNVANEYRTSNPFKALDYCEQAQKYARQLGYKRGIAEAVSNMGNIHTQQGNYDRAIEHYLEALKLVVAGLLSKQFIKLTDSTIKAPQIPQLSYSLLF